MILTVTDTVIPNDKINSTDANWKKRKSNNARFKKHAHALVSPIVEIDSKTNENKVVHQNARLFYADGQWYVIFQYDRKKEIAII